MKKYLPFLSVVLLIAGVLLCVNFRTLRLAQHVSDFFRDPGDVRKDTASRYQLDKLDLSPSDRVFLEEYLSSRTDHAWYRKMHEAHPDDLEFLAASLTQIPTEPVSCLVEQIAAAEPIQPLIDEFRRRDPQNALPDYMEAYLLHPRALDVKWENQTGKDHPVYTILDRALLERMAALFMDGLRKPYFRTYSERIPERAIRLLQLKDDFHDYVYKAGIRCGFLAFHLAVLRRVTESVLFYAETLEKEGRHEEAAAILHSGPALILQLMRQDQKTLIEALVYYALDRTYLKSAKAMKDEAAVRLYQKPADFFTAWRKTKSDDAERTIARYGGYFSRMMLPGVCRGFPITENDLEPERTINCLVFDQLALAGFAWLTSLLWILLAVIALFQRGGTVSFTRKDHLYLAGTVLLVPLMFAVLWSGRPYLLRIPLVRLLLPLGLLLVLSVPLFVFVWRRTRKDPSASFARTMLLPLACLLFLTGAVLRPLQDHGIRSAWQRDTLFRTGIWFSTVEDRMRNYLIDNLTAFFQEKKP